AVMLLRIGRSAALAVLVAMGKVGCGDDSVKPALPVVVERVVSDVDGRALEGEYARTWHIQPNGLGDAPTIQAGLDSAQAGDDVLLASGHTLGRPKVRAASR